MLLIPSEVVLHQEDQQMYINLGQGMLETGGFVRPGNGGYDPETERVPLYPMFLASVFGLLGSSLWIVVGIQSIFDAITCVIIGRMTAIFVPGALLLGGLLAAVNVTMIVTSGMVLTDTLFLLLFSAFLLSFIHYLSVRTTLFLVLSVVFLGASVLTRSAGYYLIPVIFLFLIVWWFGQRDDLKKWLIHAVAFMLCIALMIGPLLLRNQQQFGVVSITSQGGTHLLGWVVPLAKQFSEGSSYAAGQKEMQQRLAEVMQRDGISELPKNPYLNSAYLSKVGMEELLSLGVWKLTFAWASGSILNLASPGLIVMPAVRALEHPSFYATPGSNMIDKVINYLTEPGAVLFATLVATSGFASLIFFLLQFTGMVIVMSNIKEYGVWRVVFVVLVILYFLAITGPVVGVKYRLPLEPFLTVFTVVALFTFKKRWESRQLLQKERDD